MTVYIKFSKDREILFASFEVRLNNLTSPEQIVLECRWTDFIQRIVEFGNAVILRNFQYTLQMEDKFSHAI
jgi:hypothetical protein